jgi:hypothetical protein
MKKDYEEKAQACKNKMEAYHKKGEPLLEKFYRKAAIGFQLKAAGLDRRANMVIRKNKKVYAVENNGQKIYETKNQTEAEKVLAYLREKANQ